VGKGKEILINASVFVLASIISLYLFEGIFRFFILKSKIPRTGGEFSRIVSSRWPHPIDEKKKSGTYRILGLSDSFGVAAREFNYHYVLERLLRDRGMKVEVVNLSVGEYEILDEYLILKRFGERYNPDIILHGFFVGNDFYTAWNQDLLSCQDISIRVPPGVDSYLFPWKWTIWQWLDRLKITIREKKIKRSKHNGKPSLFEFNEKSFLRIERNRIAVCEVPPNGNIPWTAINNHLDMVREAAEGMGATYIMIAHPDVFQFDDDLRGDIIGEYNINVAGYDFVLPQRILKRYCQIRGIPFCDILPELKSKHFRQALYDVKGTHFNIKGNAAVAEIISQFLLGEGLLKERTKKQSAPPQPETDDIQVREI